ncbi:hypothetical protein SAMN04489712_115137 [Thermomonospora echinospora]|uniref:Uncharacterized protein n=1 Tax=Thermomonospora echinospora TaxID=1992 RepID=A0A1H6DCQ0_9ACTN|nr:hypothetical protein [Thermomonospora echinospora]SEG83070.1 hypothetical protein SAMN04489712_115137 [Thermomonospora echinospora]
MKRALTLVVTSLALAPVLAPGTAEARSARAGGISISPGTVVPGAKGTAAVTVKVKLPGLDPASLVNITARGPRSDRNWADAKDPDGDGVFVGTLRFDRMNEAGSWRIETEIYDVGSGNAHAGPSGRFSVKRPTRLTVNAAPEPVKKGATIGVGGKLTLLTQYGKPADYVPYKGQRIYVYFKRKGTKKWVSKGYTTTNKSGNYLKKFKAAYDGYWWPQYAGSAQYAGVKSGGDYVDVR